MCVFIPLSVSVPLAFPHPPQNPSTPCVWCCEGYCHISRWFNLSKSDRHIVYGRNGRTGWGIQFSEIKAQYWKWKEEMSWTRAERDGIGTEAERKLLFHVNTVAKSLISKRCFNDSELVVVIRFWIHHFSHKALLSLLLLPCGTSTIKLRHQNVRDHSASFLVFFSSFFHVCTGLSFCPLFTFHLFFICSLFTFSCIVTHRYQPKEESSV